MIVVVAHSIGTRRHRTAMGLALAVYRVVPSPNIITAPMFGAQLWQGPTAARHCDLMCLFVMGSQAVIPGVHPLCMRQCICAGV